MKNLAKAIILTALLPSVSFAQETEGGVDVDLNNVDSVFVSEDLSVSTSTVEFSTSSSSTLENLSTTTVAVSPTTSSATADVVLVDEQDVPVTSTQSIEEKLEIATKIVIKIEQVIPVFDAYLKRIELINQKLSEKGETFDQDSDFSISLKQSESVRKEAVEKTTQVKELISNINDGELDQSLVLVRSELNSIKEKIISSKGKSKEAISFLKLEVK